MKEKKREEGEGDEGEEEEGGEREKRGEDNNCCHGYCDIQYYTHAKCA